MIIPDIQRKNHIILLILIKPGFSPGRPENSLLFKFPRPQLLHVPVDSRELAGDLYALRAVGHALAAVDAVVGLAHRLDGAVVAHQVLAPQPAMEWTL